MMYQLTPGSGMTAVSAEDRALRALLPGANLVRLVMNHWHDDVTSKGGNLSFDCSSDNAPDYVNPACLAQFDAVLRWATAELSW